MHIAASPVWESWSELSTRLPCDLDRKSTRLNSSHRCISYAVFCLKKHSVGHLLQGWSGQARTGCRPRQAAARQTRIDQEKGIFLKNAAPYDTPPLSDRAAQLR